MPTATKQKPTRSAARGGILSAGLPCGRRTPRGRERWYLLRMPQGREASIGLATLIWTVSTGSAPPS